MFNLERKEMPQACQEYNTYMGAVDVVDSSIHLLANLAKTIKWTRKALFSHQADSPTRGSSYKFIKVSLIIYPSQPQYL